MTKTTYYTFLSPGQIQHFHVLLKTETMKLGTIFGVHWDEIIRSS